MPAKNLELLHPGAIGLKLYKHDARDNLIACELVLFERGLPAINTVLRRAALSGTVQVEPFDQSPDYFADVYTSPSTSEQTILLNRDSYRSLKNHWMRCRIEHED